MRSLHPSATADGTDPIQVRPLTLETKRLDTDNLIKPIQDVLKTLVYHDDVQIVDAVLRKTQLDTPLRVRGISAILGQAFTEGKEFVYIKVEDPPGLGPS